MTTNKKSFPEHVFRAYDIRGIFGQDLNSKIAEQVGKGLGTFIGEAKKIVVGRDVRLSGEELKRHLVNGLTSVGCTSTDLGVVTTPILYFTIANHNSDGGVMITASHNPPEWNGFKLCREKGLILSKGHGMEEIKRIIMEKRFNKPRAIGKQEKYSDIFDEYARFILTKVEMKKKLKVVLDPGNGSCGMIAPRLFKQMGCAIKVINEDLDGTFPSRGPEPNNHTLQQLMMEVKRTRADFGVGYDGDGDRSVFVDDRGRILAGDIIAIIFVNALITKEKNKVVYDVSCSMAVEESINAHHGIPIVERVGRPFMMNRVLKEKALFGGERSGHYYFPEIYGFDDGTYTSLKLAEILSKTDKSLSQLVDSIPHHPSRILNIPYPDQYKFAAIRQIKKKLVNLGFKIVDIDGIKAIDNEGWVLIRPSNTEPLIRVFAEGKTKQKLREMIVLAESFINEQAGKII